MKNRLKIVFFILVILVPFAIWMQIRARQIGKKDFELFYSTAINSKLKSIYASKRGTTIILLDNRKFVFLPYTNQKLNKGKIFYHIAKEGDLVIKKAYSDSLILIKNDEKLIYTFNKFE